MSFRELAGARQPLRPLGVGRWPRARRLRLPADAEPAGIPGDLARRYPRRRRGRAHQHQSRRAVAGPFGQHRGAVAHHRGGRACRKVLPARGRHLSADAKIWSHGETDGRMRRASIGRSSSFPAPRSRPASAVRSPSRTARFTSTRPARPACRKAAQVSHYRVMMWSCWFAGMMDTRPSDRMYDCLPMYHSIGGVVATGAVLVNGGSVVIREKFSAREFWDDVGRFDCTLFQYIGELCRYLVHCASHTARCRPSHQACLRQRAAARCVGANSRPVPDPADPGILCGDRGQRHDVQLRRQARRHRPHPAVSGAPLPDGAGAPRCR